MSNAVLFIKAYRLQTGVGKILSLLKIVCKFSLKFFPSLIVQSYNNPMYHIQCCNPLLWKHQKPCWTMLGSALAQAKIYGWRENSNNNKTHSISREIMASLTQTQGDQSNIMVRNARLYYGLNTKLSLPSLSCFQMKALPR